MFLLKKYSLIFKIKLTVLQKIFIISVTTHLFKYLKLTVVLLINIGGETIQ